MDGLRLGVVAGDQCGLEVIVSVPPLCGVEDLCGPGDH